MQDKKKAIELFQKAADMGNTYAMLILSHCHRDGKGVSQDKQKSIELYQTTAGMGNTHALAQLNSKDKRMTIHDLTEDGLETLIQLAVSGDMDAASLLSSLPD